MFERFKRRLIDFRNTLLILTSIIIELWFPNFGSADIAQKVLMILLRMGKK